MKPTKPDPIWFAPREGFTAACVNHVLATTPPRSKAVYPDLSDAVVPKQTTNNVGTMISAKAMKKGRLV